MLFAEVDIVLSGMGRTGQFFPAHSYILFIFLNGVHRLKVVLKTWKLSNDPVLI